MAKYILDVVLNTAAFGKVKVIDIFTSAGDESVYKVEEVGKEFNNVYLVTEEELEDNAEGK